MLTLRLKADDLPADHPRAPWTHGETRVVDIGSAIQLMRERTDDFEPVDPAPAMLAILIDAGVIPGEAPAAPPAVPEVARTASAAEMVDRAHAQKAEETAVVESAQPRKKGAK